MAIPISTITVRGTVGLILLMATLAAVRADQLIVDDAIVQGTGLADGPGAVCVGLDCVNGEAFAGDTLRLKENNLRMRFSNAVPAGAVDQSWRIIANDTANYGDSYLSIAFTSADVLEISDGSYRLSNGTAPQYDCELEEPQTTSPVIIGVIPEGQPLVQIYTDFTSANPYTCGLVPVSPAYDCSSPNPAFPPPRVSLPAGEIAIEVVTIEGVPTCIDKVDEPPVFRLGTSLAVGLALGADSEPRPVAVSIGSSTLARQLKHVAEGLAATDLLMTRTLSDYDAYADQRQAVAALAQQLAVLNGQVDDLEAAIEIAENHAPSAPVLTAPDNGASGLDPDGVTLKWRRASDADGDALKYTVTWCEDASFAGCTPVEVASLSAMPAFAALSGGSGILFFGLMAPVWRRRAVRAATAVIMLSALSACGGGKSTDDSDMQYIVSKLAEGTTYYWKVSVSDGITSTDSALRSFTTR